MIGIKLNHEEDNINYNPEMDKIDYIIYNTF